MPKKSTPTTTKKSDDSERRQVKFWLSPSEHHRLKIAAAVADCTMADLCREAVLVRANELTSGLGQTD